MEFIDAKIWISKMRHYVGFSQIGSHIMLLYAILHGNSLHVADTFIQIVLLECINESTSILYHTMTVLLEYIDCSLQFSINA